MLRCFIGRPAAYRCHCPIATHLFPDHPERLSRIERQLGKHTAAPDSSKEDEEDMAAAAVAAAAAARLEPTAQQSAAGANGPFGGLFEGGGYPGGGCPKGCAGSSSVAAPAYGAPPPLAILEKANSAGSASGMSLADFLGSTSFGRCPQPAHGDVLNTHVICPLRLLGSQISLHTIFFALRS